MLQILQDGKDGFEDYFENSWRWQGRGETASQVRSAQCLWYKWSVAQLK